MQPGVYKTKNPPEVGSWVAEHGKEQTNAGTPCYNPVGLLWAASENHCLLF